MLDSFIYILEYGIEEEQANCFGMLDLTMIDNRYLSRDEIIGSYDLPANLSEPTKDILAECILDQCRVWSWNEVSEIFSSLRGETDINCEAAYFLMKELDSMSSGVRIIAANLG